MNRRIRKVSNGTITTFAGTGATTYGGDGGLATSAGIVPGGLAVDAAGNVYVSDSGHVCKISGGIIVSIAEPIRPGTTGRASTPWKRRSRRAHSRWMTRAISISPNRAPTAFACCGPVRFAHVHGATRYSEGDREH